MTRDEVKSIVVQKIKAEADKSELLPDEILGDMSIDDEVGVSSLSFVSATIAMEEAIGLDEGTSLPWDDESIVHGVTLDTIVDFIMNHLSAAS